MNWVFLDFIRWDYDVATPRERPLGGSQSALCYLAAALARRGHASHHAHRHDQAARGRWRPLPPL